MASALGSVVAKKRGKSLGGSVRTSKHLAARAFVADVTDLCEETDVRKLIPYAPFRRLVLAHLTYGVRRVSTEALQALMEATILYVQEMYEDSYYSTVIGGKRQVLMVRDVKTTIRSKGAAIVHAPNSSRRGASSRADDDAEDSGEDDDESGADEEVADDEDEPAENDAEASALYDEPEGADEEAVEQHDKEPEEE